MARRRMAALVLSEAERTELTSLARRRNTARALALCARIALGCAEGGQNKQVAARLQVDQGTVGDILASIDRFCVCNAPAEA